MQWAHKKAITAPGEEDKLKLGVPPVPAELGPELMTGPPKSAAHKHRPPGKRCPQAQAPQKALPTGTGPPESAAHRHGPLGKPWGEGDGASVVTELGDSARPVLLG